MNRMFTVSIIMLAIVIFTFNCKSDSTKSENDDNNVPAELIATWIASQFIMINNSNPSEQVDIIQLGISLSMVIDSDGHYTSTMLIPDDPSITETGTLDVQGNQMIFDPDGVHAPYSITFTLSGDTLTGINDDSEFDFDDDGTEETATSTIVLQKSTPSPAELVAYYPFNGNADDEHGNNNGIVHGASLTTDRFDNAASAYQFDGANDYISIVNTLSLDTNVISIAAWIKINALAADWMDIVSYGSGGHVLAVDENGHVIGGIQFSWTCEFEGSTNTATGDWFFITLTRESNHIIKLYVNSIEEAIDFCSFIPIYNDSISICRDPGGFEYFNGSIDEVRIYNGVLTPEEIQSIYEM